jgi:hypothetical protein
MWTMRAHARACRPRGLMMARLRVCMEHHRRFVDS